MFRNVNITTLVTDETQFVGYTIHLKYLCVHVILEGTIIEKRGTRTPFTQVIILSVSVFVTFVETLGRQSFDD